jgi:hypothetical protein
MVNCRTWLICQYESLLFEFDSFESIDKTFSKKGGGGCAEPVVKHFKFILFDVTLAAQMHMGL